MLSALLFVIAKPRNDPNVHQDGVLGNILWQTDATEYYAAVKKNCSCMPQHRWISKAHCEGITASEIGYVS